MSVANQFPTPKTCREVSMKMRPRHCLPTLLSIFLSGGFLFAEEPPKKASDKGTELFESKILPVLVKHCYECHSKDGESIEGGLELDSPSGMLRGGDTGAMLEAHHADQSRLLQMLRHEGDVSGMPPEEKLSDDVIAAFEEWIRLGAPDTREDKGPTAKEQRLDEAMQHWSFLPPQVVKPPAVKDASWSRDPLIDNFILARLEAEGLKPARDANRRTLVRRVYFDLIGLPPSPEDMNAFLVDDSPDALEKLVDRLLGSPQFGERWGRHWLDVVRYAESSGMEFNFTYPHAWPYRNYVVDSLNADKPYDIFLREQIAGDLLPSVKGETPEVVETRRIAPSMLAFGPKRHNSSGTDFQMNIADDQIDVVTKSTLALTVSCARCHDHKFDPIPTKDYYAMAGIFLSTEPLCGTIKQKYSNTPTDLLPIGKGSQTLHDAAEQHEKKITLAEKPLAEKQTELKKATETVDLAVKERVNAEELLAAVTARKAATKIENEAATEETDSAVADTSEQDSAQKELDDAVAKLTTATAHAKALKVEVAKLDASLKQLKKNRPTRPQYAMSVRDRAKPADTKIAIRGDFRTRGEVAPRGFLSAVNVPNTPLVDPTHSGRLELAQWITDSGNPLTARVMVNRIWHHLFGRGIVPTVDNFGLIGKLPSHPDLLDSLALRFVDEGWSVKKMVRAMVLSRTYQLSCEVNEKSLTVDPNNRLLWRASPRRLDAEAIRDAILMVSGKLELQRPVGSTVTPLGDKLVRSISTDKIQPPSNHRSVYLPVVRDYVPELFELFDFPSPSLVSGARAITNVPAQALYLRNSKFVAEQSKHAAQRLLESKEPGDDAGRVALAMQWSLGREPTDIERTAALQMINEIKQAEVKEGDSKDVNAWSAWFLTLFTTAEFRYLVDAEG